ncbi:hypothetical protein F444_03196 [Phytophthora nicotianae P1976]|uniref:Uncharacterized protein n=1 Tax=Phytophthora nicotianae P1976 TaxID=1317066 RepID=A0A081AUY5_PHYNI|nr:hypothetical protein F444_03196 [Phytophthora nicotianae P1976]
MDTRKRRQRACKARGGETTFYCGGCKLKTSSRNAQAARVFLCNKVKHTSNGDAISCFEIWHKHWKNGTWIPQSRGKRKIRAQKPAPAAASDADADDGAGGSGDESRSDEGSQRRKWSRDGGD